MRCLMRGTAFRFFVLAAAFELLVSLPSRGQEAKWPATTEGDYVAKNFKFRSGETLPELRLHYTTLGKPAREPLLHHSSRRCWAREILEAQRRAARSLSAIRL